MTYETRVEEKKVGMERFAGALASALLAKATKLWGADGRGKCYTRQWHFPKPASVPWKMSVRKINENTNTSDNFRLAWKMSEWRIRSGYR